MKLFFRKVNKSSKGFTLVETLVAISIFTMSLLSLMVILGKSISDTGYAKQRGTAIYLAQEGIEYMRNMRDTFVLYGGSAAAGWTNFNNELVSNSCTSLPNGCFFNADGFLGPMNQLTLSPCSNSTCSNAQLKYDKTTGQYGYSAGVNSGFVRQITVTQVSNETKILSTVYWTQGSGSYNFTFSENLFNWIE